MAQSVAERYSYLRQELKEISSKLIQLEIDLQQHERVLETIEPLENGRKCFRLVGEVLVQSTIGESKPSLSAQKENLKELVNSFRSKKALKEKEIMDFEKDNHIQFKSINELQDSNEKQ